MQNLDKPIQKPDNLHWSTFILSFWYQPGEKKKTKLPSSTSSSTPQLDPKLEELHLNLVGHHPDHLWPFLVVLGKKFPLLLWNHKTASPNGKVIQWSHSFFLLCTCTILPWPRACKAPWWLVFLRLSGLRRLLPLPQPCHQKATRNRGVMKNSSTFVQDFIYDMKETYPTWVTFFIFHFSHGKLFICRARMPCSLLLLRLCLWWSPP